jgi:hypothetical protein
MKKLLGIVVLGLLLSGNAYAEKVNLECGDKSNFNDMLYVKANKKTLEVYQPSSGNKLKFKVQRFDEYAIATVGRGLDKASTSYDTHLTDWDAWDGSFYIKSTYIKLGLKEYKDTWVLPDQKHLGLDQANMNMKFFGNFLVKN